MYIQGSLWGQHSNKRGHFAVVRTGLRRETEERARMWLPAGTPSRPQFQPLHWELTLKFSRDQQVTPVVLRASGQSSDTPALPATNMHLQPAPRPARSSIGGRRPRATCRGSVPALSLHTLPELRPGHDTTPCKDDMLETGPE